MNLLQEVKDRLLITGDFHDKILIGLIEDVKQYMISAGVDETVVDSKKSIGCIAKGVFDLFNNNEFSDFFVQRTIQLSVEEATDEEPVPLLPPVEDDTNVSETTPDDSTEGGE